MANEEFKHIVRIANTDVKGEKPIAVSLTKIKGVGKHLAQVVCKLANLQFHAKTGNLSNEELTRLNEILQNPEKHHIPTWMFNRRKDMETGKDRHILTTDLQWSKENDLKHMMKMRSYKGIRHMFRIPVRGQRTRSNFRKNKGKVMGVKKKGKGGKK